MCHKNYLEELLIIINFNRDIVAALDQEKVKLLFFDYIWMIK